MKIHINNERGSLPYTIMILMVLMVFVPGLLMMASATTLNDIRSESEKKATHLAVSGMQSYVNYPGSVIEKMNFLKNSPYYKQRNEVLLPEGDTVYYYQYVVPFDLADSYSNAVESVQINTAQKYKVVVEAFVGDDNFNRQRDDGETFFYKKKLVTTYDPTIGGKTATPLITPLPKVGNPITGTVAEPNAWVYVHDSTGVLLGSDQFIDTTNDSIVSTGFSITANRTLVANEVIKVTAITDGKTLSNIASATVAAQNAPPPDDDGIVIIVDEEGNETQVGMDDSIDTEEQIIITPAVGNYETDNGIELSGDEGIIVAEGVSLTTTSNGADAGLSLSSSRGDIVLTGTILEGTGNSQHSEITIIAQGDVYINNAIITAERSITIKAGGNIHAEDATITSIKNEGVILLELTDTEAPVVTGNIYVKELWLNKNGTATLASGAICGTMDPDSGNLNNLKVHGTCP